jgi:predicted hotdog family 3-hydroxylacyl-ACP dehydratase
LPAFPGDADAMLIGADRIRALIPHQGSMCLLDGVIAWDGDTIQCTASSHHAPDNPLRRNGRLSAVCGIEYAAQAMALHGALTAQGGQAQRPGLLASVRDTRCHAASLDSAAGVLSVEARLLMSEGARVIYSFSLSCEGLLLVEGRAAVVLGAPG